MRHYFNVGEKRGEGGRKKPVSVAIDNERIKIKRWRERIYIKLCGPLLLSLSLFLRLRKAEQKRAHWPLTLQASIVNSIYSLSYRETAMRTAWNVLQVNREVSRGTCRISAGKRRAGFNAMTVTSNEANI